MPNFLHDGELGLPPVGAPPPPAAGMLEPPAGKLVPPAGKLEPPPTGTFKPVFVPPDGILLPPAGRLFPLAGRLLPPPTVGTLLPPVGRLLPAPPPLVFLLLTFDPIEPPLLVELDLLAEAYVLTGYVSSLSMLAASPGLFDIFSSLSSFACMAFSIRVFWD